VARPIRCPFCATSFPAPATAAGCVAVCPGCGYALVPAAPIARARPAPGPAPPSPAPPPSQPVAQVTTAATPDDSGELPAPGWLSVFGLASLLLAVVGLVCSFGPALCRLTPLFASAALLLGYTGVLRAVALCRVRLLTPVGGTAAGGALLIAGAAFPSLLGDAYRSFRENRARETEVAAIAVTDRPQDAAAVEESGWVDASRGAAQQGRVRVLITGAGVGPADLKEKSGKRASRERYLIVRVRVQHTGAGAQFTFAGWGGASPSDEANAGRLTDEGGKALSRATLPTGTELAGVTRGKVVFPGSGAEDVLLFEPPAAATGSLRLELPAEACEGKGTFRFRIPRSMIATQAAEPGRPR
jgi:hypothetical protein